MSCDVKGPITATECTPCSHNVRNRYFRGKLMTVADYQAEQLYMIQRRRSMNRLLLGWGVVKGFAIKRHGDALVIGEGVALDPCGREIIACDTVTINDSDDILWLDEGHCGLESTEPFKPGCYLLSAHYAERLVDGVRVATSCEDSECESNHICETVAYSLQPIDPKRSPILRHECSDLGPRPGQQPSPWSDQLPLVGPVDNRGQASLCIKPRYDPCCVPRLSHHGDLSVDFNAGVTLAVVCLVHGDCNKLAFTDIREIIRGCELTRIQDIGWRNWHEMPNGRIHTYSFFDMFVTPGEDEERQERQERRDGRRRKGEPVQRKTYPPVDTKFWVCFSAPVQIASLTKDAFTITRYELDTNEAVAVAQRIEVAGLWNEGTLPGDPHGTTRGIRPFVTHEFWDGEIEDDASSSFNRKTLIELRINGDKIIDWAGRPIDGNSIAHRLPSGNLTPGGEFLSSFWVVPDGEDVPPCKEGESTQTEGTGQTEQPHPGEQALEPGSPEQARQARQSHQAGQSHEPGQSHQPGQSEHSAPNDKSDGGAS